MHFKPSLQLLLTKIIRLLRNLQRTNICLFLASLWVINMLYRVKDNVSAKHSKYPVRCVTKNFGVVFGRMLASIQAPSVIGTSEQLTSGAPPNTSPAPLLRSSPIKLHRKRPSCSHLYYTRNLFFICPTTYNCLYIPDAVKLWTKMWCAWLV
jgi:hypothetical protein